MRSGYVGYRGPSLLDGSPVTVVLTQNTTNRKTGADMAQTWILRSDLHPVVAVRSGADAAICGDCRHRGSTTSRSCYVTVQHGPAAIYRALLAGRYVEAPSWVGLEPATPSVRLGAYGDPAAVPYDVWARLLPLYQLWTGYTHQWRACDQRLRSMCMASVDSREELVAARMRGWRTFRVRTAHEPLLSGEITCPASAEAGHRTTCAECGLCRGVSFGAPAVNIAIQSHGGAAARFYRDRHQLGLF